MPTYKITEPQSGKVFRITGDSPPTEQELEQIFSSVGGGSSSETNTEVKTIPQKIAGAVAPYAPIAGATAGGILAAPANIIAPGVAEALGVGGGYLVGSEAERRLKEFAGEKERPEDVLAAFKETGRELPGAAETAVSGPLVGKGLSTVLGAAGKLGKQVLGRLSGTGTGAVEEAIASGEKTGLFTRQNPFASKTDYDKALRGKITGEEVVQNAKTAVQKVRDDRGIEYVTKLQNIRTNPQALNTARNEVNTELAKLTSKNEFDINIGLSPRGKMTIDFKTSPLVKNQAVIQKAITDVKTWQDNSAAGLDVLKKRLSKYIDQTPSGSPSEAFLTRLEKSLNKGLKDAVPGYAEMTKGYAEATTLIKDIESGLMLRKEGMTGRVVADQTLRRLVSSMRDNFELRRDLVKALSENAGKDIMGQAAGYAMRSPLPIGLAGTGPTLVGEAALAHFVNPSFYPVLAASSPRLQGEFLRLFGKGLAEARGLSGPAGTAIAAGVVKNRDENYRKMMEAIGE